MLLGSGSPPFVSYLSLVSYRDVRSTLQYSAFPPLQWIGITTGEGAIQIAATCLIAIVGPALAGLDYWRYCRIPTSTA